MARIKDLFLDIIADVLNYLERLPLKRYEFHNVPAVPIRFVELLDTLYKLEHRTYALSQAKTGLSNIYPIKGHLANSYTYLYSDDRKKAKTRHRRKLQNEVQLVKAPKLTGVLFNLRLAQRLGKYGYVDKMPPGTPLNLLPLDTPEQFSISWTTFYDIYNGSQSYLPGWAATLKTVSAATAQFWPTIARYGMAYNLLILQKLNTTKAKASQPEIIKAKFGAEWNSAWDELLANGLLYVIDMSIFESLSPQQVRGNDRFTPATITLLQQDATTKELVPVAVRVAGHNGAGAQVFTETNSTPFAWIYALQAAKCSITVYGIWLGHVYHWHIVTAALQMTFNNSLSKEHALYKMLSPQFNYLIPFDDALLLLWQSAAPPTSISSGYMFLEFIDTYATNRGFFDDDPKTTLDLYGICEADFSVKQPWDGFPIAGYVLSIWDATNTYVKKCVGHFFTSDQMVADDTQLQRWIATSKKPRGGNVQGIGPIQSVKELTDFLTSVVYRVSVHGCARLNPTANPALSFVANFPPCIQNQTIPAPGSNLTQQDILNYLPNTGTIGEMMTFYNTFGFSAPYVPFLPLAGNDSHFSFAGNASFPPNAALLEFRNTMQKFIIKFTNDLKLPGSVANAPQIHQWPLCIET